MIVILGDHAPNAPSSVRRQYRMLQHVHHPQFHIWAWYDADLAIVKLAEEVNYNDSVIYHCVIAVNLKT